MKILYDHQIFSTQKYGGISLYFSELMSQFSLNPDIDFHIALGYSNNQNIRNKPLLNKYWSKNNLFCPFINQFPFIEKHMPDSIMYRILNNQKESERLLKKQDFHVFHPTYYNPYFLKYLHNKPFVITVYDMIHELFPMYFSTSDPTRKWKKELIYESDFIIAISKNTKDDIIKLFDIDPEKIFVVHLGNPFESFTRGQEPEKIQNVPVLGESYLLYVGNRQGYKNYIFFVQSIADFLRQNGIYLYCAGGEPFTDQEREMLEKLGIQNFVRFIRVNDKILMNLYKNALAFVFPSLYEGFGLPVLEAFSCGCPALLSNTSSLPEIGGNAAIYFDPTNSDSIVNGIESLLSDEKRRNDLISQGYQRLNYFSWRKTAMQTLYVYNVLLQSVGH